MENFITLLKNIDLFNCFSVDELSCLFSKDSYSIRQYSKNSVVYFQNERCESLDVVLDGVIEIQKIDSNGDILTICTFTSGEIMGENLLFSHNNSYPMTVFSKSNSRILHIKKELILKLCQNNTSFLDNFFQSISDKTLILTNKIKLLTIKTIRQCMIDFLLYEYHLQKSAVIKLGISKKDLAEKLGIQRSSLSRELNKMRQDGLIIYDSKSITIKDIDLLRKFRLRARKF